MKFIDKLDRKYSHLGIPNLMMYIMIANVAVFAMDLLNQGRISAILAFSPYLIMQGQVWRIFTFVFIPPLSAGTFSPLTWIFFAFVVYFYYFIGQTLERQWGVFKFNLFYFSGIIIMIVSGLLFKSMAMAAYLHSTLFLAFATLYPNYQIRIYFILPIKIKYLAYLTTGIYVLQMIMGGTSTRISVIAGLANYLIFFGPELISGRKNRIKNMNRKHQYVKSSRVYKEFHHKCEECGKTENDDSELEFRYCSKCEGLHEYCMEHLNNHEHKINDNED